MNALVNNFVSTFALALRNLLRNRRRTASTLAAMALGLCAVMLFGGFIGDIERRLQTETVRHLGHVQIQAEGYQRFGQANPAQYGVANYRDIIEAIQRDTELGPMVRVATPVLRFDGIAGNFAAGMSRTVTASGTIPADQARMLAWNDYALPGQIATPALAGSAPDAAVVGAGVAKLLDLCAALSLADCHARPSRAERQGNAMPDDLGGLAGIAADEPGAKADGTAPARAAAQASAKPRIELMASDAHGSPNVVPLDVVGVERQDAKERDDVYVGLHLDYAQKLIFGAAQPKATAIELQLEHTAQMPLARARLAALLHSPPFNAQPLALQDFQTLNPFYGQSMLLLRAIFVFVSALIATIVLFMVGNTMSMAVAERTAEIGTLRALGMRRLGVRSLFLYEGLLLGVLGAALGVALEAMLAWSLGHAGLTWVLPGQAEASPLSAQQQWSNVPSYMAALALAAMLSAFLPAARSARMNIVDALRHV